MLQHVNNAIFPDVDMLMNNIVAVTSHIRKKLEAAGTPDIDRKVLHFGIQTAGFGDPLQASQLTVCFADEHETKFGFIGQDDLFAVANAISRRIL